MNNPMNWADRSRSMRRLAPQSAKLPITNDTEVNDPSWGGGAYSLDRIGKRVPTGVDTRLITPYTSYLLRGFQ